MLELNTTQCGFLTNGFAVAGWDVRMHPVRVLQHFMSQLLVEPGQVPRARSHHAGLQVRKNTGLFVWEMTTPEIAAVVS